MAPADVFRKYRSAIAHLVFSRDGKRVSSGSGFVVDNYLITCAHVVDAAGDLSMQVRFPYATGPQSPTWEIPDGIRSLTFRGYSAEKSYDYAIIEPPAGIIVGSGLQFALDEPDVGTPVCSLGYPFEHEELTLSTGHVSATTDSGVARMLKLDMSVNPSNSGGPLIDLNSGRVSGVVARKSTGLSSAFEELRDSFDANLKALKEAGGIAMSGIDPFEVMRATQYQMKAVAIELERSAQVGIGWAVYVDPLRAENAFDC